MAMATLSPNASMEEIKWVFDMCGFVLFPSVLSDEDTAAMIAEVEETLAWRQDAGGGLPDGQHMAPGVQRRLPATHEQMNPGTPEQPGYLNYLNFGGRCGELLDHPLLNGLLNEILGDGGQLNDQCYNFRCDDMMTTIRRPGKTDDGASASNVAWVSAPQPHNVPPGHGLRYRSGSGLINAGRARAVWELAGVETPTSGGTLLMPGSHKAEFQRPASMDVDATRSLMQSYACPPGSLLVFTESLLHATAEWTHPTRDRIAIFTHYCNIYSQFHRLLLPHDAIAAMPKLRQTLFRGVWAGDWGGLDGQKAGERGARSQKETNAFRSCFGAVVVNACAVFAKTGKDGSVRKDRKHRDLVRF
jgi:hypothetical protein